MSKTKTTFKGRDGFSYKDYSDDIYAQGCKLDFFPKGQPRLLTQHDMYWGGVTGGLCPECGFPIRALDQHHAEHLCAHCGLILQESIHLPDPAYFHEYIKEPLPDGSVFLRKEEKLLIAKWRKQRYDTPMGEWRFHQYSFFADQVVQLYHMDGGLAVILKSIIFRYKLKDIHSKISFEKIILGITIEILRRMGRLIPFSEKFVQITHLKKEEQKVIRQNLHALHVFK